MRVHRQRERFELTVARNATIRFPNRTFVQLTLLEAPEVGMNIEAQGASWRITCVRLPWGLDQQGGVVYDVDVEPAARTPTANG